MGISGSLNTFSLPEILKIIEQGFKTGQLSIISYSKEQSTTKDKVNSLWFKDGRFIALSKIYQHKLLLHLIKEKKMIGDKDLAKIHKIEHKINIPLGKYCLKEGWLTNEQLKSLFNQQIKELSLLFTFDNGSFIFEDTDLDNLNSTNPTSPIIFPWIEMTGRSCQPSRISLNILRSLEKLNQRLIDQIPESSSGLIRLVDNHNFQLLPIEACLWNDADAKTSLKEIAQKTLFDIKELQKAALRLILIGLIEEITITEYSPKMSSFSSLTKIPVLASENNLAVTRQQHQVSNSLIGNLVNFLRNNF